MAKTFQSILTFIMLGCIAVAVQQTQSGNNLQPGITMFDIGQGDAIYIRTETGQDILIDGGPDSVVLEQLQHVMVPGDDTIELAILTHPHADHYKGLQAVLKQYTVKQIITASAESAELLTESDAIYTIVKAGDEITLNPQETFQILSPQPNAQTDDANDASVVALYTHQAAVSTTMLFTGDAGELPEQQMLQQGILSDIDILKVGHHGSKTSSTQPFIDALKPEACLVSVGQGNRYGHPTQDAIQRLQAHCSIYRTDELGNVQIRWNEGGYAVD